MENTQIHKQFWNIVIIAEDLIEESKGYLQKAHQSNGSNLIFEDIVYNLADALIATSTLFDRDHLTRNEQRLICTQLYPQNCRKRGNKTYRQAIEFIEDMCDAVRELENGFSPEQWVWRLDQFLINIVKTRLNYTLKEEEGFEIEEERD